MRLAVLLECGSSHIYKEKNEWTLPTGQILRNIHGKIRLTAFLCLG